MTDSITRLVVVSVPPQPLRGRLESLRAELCAVGRSVEALRYPAHLTLRTGVLLPENDRAGFFQAFREHARGIAPFRVTIGRLVAELWPDGTQQGAGAPFAGFQIVETAELMAAHEALASFSLYRKGAQYPYHPHLTMAFDDLSVEGLEAIRRAAAGHDTDFEGEGWLCDAAEFQRHVGDSWVTDTVVPLGMR